jgi:hypothetical protein
MAKNLYRNETQRDIYWLIDLWTLLSPRLVCKGSRQLSPSKNNHEGGMETIEEVRYIYDG